MWVPQKSMEWTLGLPFWIMVRLENTVQEFAVLSFDTRMWVALELWSFGPMLYKIVPKFVNFAFWFSFVTSPFSSFLFSFPLPITLFPSFLFLHFPSFSFSFLPSFSFSFPFFLLYFIFYLFSPPFPTFFFVAFYCYPRCYDVIFHRLLLWVASLMSVNLYKHVFDCELKPVIRTSRDVWLESSKLDHYLLCLFPSRDCLHSLMAVEWYQTLSHAATLFVSTYADCFAWFPQAV